MSASNDRSVDDKRDLQESAEAIRMEGPIGGLMTFNAEHGYLEALLRGFRSGFLKTYEYRQLCQCESLEDVKLTLGDTDYCNVLSNVSKLTPEIILRKCEDKFLAEFDFLKSQAVGQLATFLDFLTYEDLIKNICLVIKSLIQGADPRSVLDRTSRFGRSPHLRSVLTFENLNEGGDGLLELYRTVLIDTPVAPYFEAYFNQELNLKNQSGGGGGGGDGHRDISKVYNEVEIDIITNMIQKLWLEDFQRYCAALGGETADLMNELLDFEADRRAISIVLNSFNTPLNDSVLRDSERKKLFCSFGTLYPDTTLFHFSKVGDFNQLQQSLEPYRSYGDLFRSIADGSKTIDDALYEQEVKLSRKAFDGQSHFASFYGWIKLKRQELRNLEWILQCIHQKREAKDFNKWIKIF